MKFRILLATTISFLVLGAFVILIPRSLPTLSLSDDAFVEATKQKVANYHQKQAFERIYLHTDRALYAPGETIWFSGYLQALGQKVSRLSNVVHVMIKDAKGSVIGNMVYPVIKGKIRGDFLIDSDMPGGIYEMTAYTQWMKNEGEAHYFKKKIQVQKVIKPRLLLKLDFKRKSYGANDWVEATLKARDAKDQPIAGEEINFQASLSGVAYKKDVTMTNGKGEARIRFQLPAELKNNDGLLNVIVTQNGVSESISRAIPLVLNKITLDFYPEGGNWAAGTSNNMAFKALNEFYKPADIEGVVLDSKGNTVQTLKSFHDGMGAFALTPKAGEKYQVKITKPAGIGKSYSLPMAKQNEMALSVKSDEAQQLKIQFFTPKTDTFYLAVQSGGKVHYMQKLLANQGIAHQTVSVKSFPIGIAKVTLFDRAHAARCERLVFLNPHKKLNIQIKMPRKSYQPREKVEAEVLTTNELGQPVKANLSLAIVDDKMHTLADDKQDNILSYLLMSEELKGKVHEPNFYFKADEPKAKTALDYVMLTHGWRRYEWASLKASQASKLAFQKEFFEDLSGRVYNMKKRRGNEVKGKPVRAKVTLIELGGKKRALQINTDQNGRFTFKNVDPFVDIQLIAQNLSWGKKTCLIEVDQMASRKGVYDLMAQLAGRAPGVQQVTDNELLINRQKQVSSRGKKGIKSVGRIRGVNTGGLNLNLNESSALNEVLVVSYGIESRTSLVGGLKVTNRDGARGQGYQYIRGAISSGRPPLLVLDGVPISHESFTTNISPDDLVTVKVLKGNRAVNQYGSQAQYGTVFIETNQYVNQPKLAKHSKPKERAYFGHCFVDRFLFTPARIFRAKEYQAKDQNPKKRTDFRNTIYWNPEVMTDAKGQAKITFWNNDALTTFRIIAEGVGSSGQLGRTEQTYFAKLPFELTAKIPPYFSVGDSLQLPVYLSNNTNQAIQGRVKITAPGAFVFQEKEVKITVAPQSNQTIYLSGQVTRNLQQADGNQLQVAFDHQQYHESFQKAVEVIGRGFPIERSFAGTKVVNRFEFRPDQIIPGTLEAELVAYPNIMKDLVAGVQSIIRRPYGCFEQVSASTYPNILALQFLQKTGNADPAFARKAMKYIKEGYRKLAAYETSQHGFEWYGSTPPHEGLTAFGLLEFLEMKKVYSGVSEDMLVRTKKWLLSRRNGRGGFKQHRGKYGFAAASPRVNNAYLVYALTQAGEKGLTKEYEAVVKEALKGQDAYRLALATLASINLNNTNDTQKLLKVLRKQIRKFGLGKLPVAHTLVYSYGVSAQIETVALIALAEMRLPQPDLKRVIKLVDFLAKNRRSGYFGSTQGTILALQALTKYAELQGMQAKTGKLLVYQGRKQIGELSYSKNQLNNAQITGLEQYLTKHGGDITVRFKAKKQIVPFNLNIRYQTLKPNSSSLCNLDLETRLSAQTVKVNETVRLTTIIRNKKDQGQPSTLAIVGIPSGLSPQPWQLKALVEKEQVAYYEIYGSYIVFYLREMAPKMVKTIHLDLKADVPGWYQAPASSAYLYYTSEHKDWAAGTQVLVRPALAN